MKMTSTLFHVSVPTGHKNLVCTTRSQRLKVSRTVAPVILNTPQCSRGAVSVHAFLPGMAGGKFWKQMGQLANKFDTKGKEERLAVLHRFYTQLDLATAESLVAPDFKMWEMGGSRSFGRNEFLDLMYSSVLPAVPDFSWGFASTGEVDDEGWVVVTVAATGHHTGAAFALPGMPPIPPSGKHFCLEDEVQKVRLHGGQVTEVCVLPTRGAGPRALYFALSGGDKVPPAAVAQTVPPAP